MQRYRHYGTSSSSVPVEELHTTEEEVSAKEQAEEPLVKEKAQDAIGTTGGGDVEEAPSTQEAPLLSDSKSPSSESKNGKKTQGADAAGGAKYSVFTWFVVLALLGVWSSVAVVYFDIVDYDSVIGKLTAYDTDGDGDFDVEDAKVLLDERKLRGPARRKAAHRRALRELAEDPDEMELIEDEIPDEATSRKNWTREPPVRDAVLRAALQKELINEKLEAKRIARLALAELKTHLSEEDQKRETAWELKMKTLEVTQEQLKLERERISVEKERMQVEKKRMEVERERMDWERAEREKERMEREKERAQKERMEWEKAEKERREQEKAEMQRMEQEKAERERTERAKAEKERVEQEKLASQKAKEEREHLEKMDRERLVREREKAAKEREEKERMESERLAREKAEEERKERDRTNREMERLQKEQLAKERERLENEKLERERTAREKEKAERERQERERMEKERLIREKARLAQEKAARDKMEAERLHAPKADLRRQEERKANSSQAVEEKPQRVSVAAVRKDKGVAGDKMVAGVRKK
ncbi:apical junction molecule isoform X4 [Dunckerocampus dactyliophorus]|uniref:apical junction molecule isoform X4 n=1 Tax=Dunckerocampus dactyliophorus TaxID=161453 RepID=UPI0024059A25|nr:apical junction molecule isoform X4 [Dunckerocampus dactyliophorus]